MAPWQLRGEVDAMSESGHIFQLNVSRGGVPKRAVAEAWVDAGGMAGDRQADRRIHGGPDRALCLYAVEVLAGLRAEGHPIAPGCAGENLTTEGLDWRRVVPGVRLRLGADALVEITSYTTPCWKNARWFRDGDPQRMSQAEHPGESRVYARVLRPGLVRTGDPVELVEETAAERVRRQQPKTFRWPRDFA
jgi:MOSC domain-containing protein YiiM